MHTGGLMDIKKILSFVAFMLLSIPIAFAQSTTVNGTIVDPSGNIWANATVTAQFQQTPNTPGPYVWSGGAYNTQPAAVTTDSTGAFSISLPSNSAIAPSGSSWQFTVAPNATLPAAIVNIQLTGGTLDIVPIITAFSAWPVGNIQGTFVSKAYNVTQVGSVPLNVGALVYNTTLKQLEFWNGSVWAPIGSGGGGSGTPAGNGVVQFSNLGGTNFVSGATIDTDVYSGSAGAQAVCTTTVCDLFTPANSTNLEPGESLPTLAGGKISGMWIDHRGNRLSEYFTNPGIAPSFPTFSQAQAAHPINIIYTEPNPAATAGTEQNDRFKIDYYTSPGFSNGNAGCPLFCPPVGYSSVAQWSIFNDTNDQITINSAGIGNSAGEICVFAGAGDHQCGLGGMFVQYAGGYMAPSDEGLHAMGSAHIYSLGDWQGTITSLTDANHFKASQSANAGQQGQGRFLLDFSNIPKDNGGTTLSNTTPVDLITEPIGITPGYVTINSVTLPASTAVGTTTNDCTVPTQFGGVATGQNGGVDGCQITVSSGAFVAGTSPVCMAHNSGNLFDIGMKMLSNPTVLSGGHQTIYASMHRSIPAGSIVFQGGACSWGILLNGDGKGGQSQNNTVVFGSVFPIVGSEAHKLYYLDYNSSQAWNPIPNPGSQWGSRDTGNTPAAHGFFFTTLTRTGGFVTGLTGSHGQTFPPGWEMLSAAKFFSVSGCADPSFNTPALNAVIGMPGPEANRITYAQAGPNAVCNNAVIALQNTTIGPVFLAEVYDVTNHSPGLAPYQVVDGTFALSYQPNFHVGDVMDSPPHYAANADGLRISQEIAQPMYDNAGLAINLQNVSSYTGAAITIHAQAPQNEYWGNGGTGYPAMGLHFYNFTSDLIHSDYAPAPQSALLNIGYSYGTAGDPAVTPNYFRHYDIWRLNGGKDNLNWDIDNQIYTMCFDFGNCTWSMSPTGSFQSTPAIFTNIQYALNFNGTYKAVTAFSECAPLNNNGFSPSCYHPIVTNNAVVTQTGTPGTTAYNYIVAVNDVNGIDMSRIFTNYTGNAVLSNTNYNNIPCTDIPAGLSGAIYAFVNPAIFKVGDCASSASVVLDKGIYGPGQPQDPLIDGGWFDSGGFRAQGLTGMFGFSQPFAAAGDPTAITASFNQESPGVVDLNGTTRGDKQGSLQLLNLTVNGTCTGCGGGGGIADVTFALPTSSIGANSCTAVGTVPMAGLTTAMGFYTAFTSDPSGVNGWGANGGMVFTAWPTANTLNWKVCNQTSGAITPGAIGINVGAR